MALKPLREIYWIRHLKVFNEKGILWQAKKHQLLLVTAEAISKEDGLQWSPCGACFKSDSTGQRTASRPPPGSCPDSGHCQVDYFALAQRGGSVFPSSSSARNSLRSSGSGCRRLMLFCVTGADLMTSAIRESHRDQRRIPGSEEVYII